MKFVFFCSAQLLSHPWCEGGGEEEKLFLARSCCVCVCVYLIFQTTPLSLRSTVGSVERGLSTPQSLSRHEILRESCVRNDTSFGRVKAHYIFLLCVRKRVGGGRGGRGGFKIVSCHLRLVSD